MSQNLFAYGTLLDQEVQQYVFQRTLEGEEDVLPFYIISSKKMYGRYLVLEPSANMEDEVAGKAFSLEDRELHIADVYEGPAYKRQLVSLKSGRKAWVYVEK